jgi:hypothetical protein
MRPTVICALLVAVAIVPPALQAQIASVAVGERVRITRVTGSKIAGTLLEVSPDELTVYSGGARSRSVIERATIAGLERSIKRESRFMRNFGITLGAGLVTGGLLGAATYSPCESTGFMSCFMAPASRGDAAVFGSIVGGVIATPIAIIVGITTKHDTWEQVTLSGGAESQLIIGAARGALQLGAALRW